MFPFTVKSVEHISRYDGKKLIPSNSAFNLFFEFISL